MTTRSQDAVKTLIDQGAPFDHIEDYIDTLPLQSEERSALWLLAWAEASNPPARRRFVAQTLAQGG